MARFLRILHHSTITAVVFSSNVYLFLFRFQYWFPQNFEFQIFSPSLPSPHPATPCILIAPSLYMFCLLSHHSFPSSPSLLFFCGPNRFLYPITSISYFSFVRKNNSKYLFLILWMPISPHSSLHTHPHWEGKLYNIGYICVVLQNLPKWSCCIRLTCCVRQFTSLYWHFFTICSLWLKLL